MTNYLIAFVLWFWPYVASHPRQFRDMKLDAIEVAALDTSAWKKVRMMNIAALESGFIRDAVGPLGERGAWQVYGGSDYSAKEALRRLDAQGMVGYVGCRSDSDIVRLKGVTTTCAKLIANRVDRANLWIMAVEPPANDVASHSSTQVNQTIAIK
jgi:hypothetical protein